MHPVRPAPTGEAVDHVADVTEGDAVVEISQDPGEEEAEDHLIKGPAAAGGEEISEKEERCDGDEEKNPPLSLRDSKDRAVVLGVFELKPAGPEINWQRILQIGNSQRLGPQVQT